MDKQIIDMNDLAESLVEQAPMSVASEIEVALEDAIMELQTAIKNTKDKAMAQWDITTATQDMMQGLDSKIYKTLDKILAKRKTEFQTIEQDMENLIERRHTEFESHVEVFIENETGNRDESTLHQSLTIALAEAAEQMSNTKEDAKKAVDDYIAMRKQELEDKIDEIRRNMSNDDNNRNMLNDNNSRNMSNDNNRQEHDYTPMPSKSSHTGHQDTNHQAPWKRQVTLNRNNLQVTSNIPRFRTETIQHNLTNDPRQDQLESFYDSLATTMDAYEMPILRRQELQPRGTTVPLDPTVHDETLQKITRILFGKLLETIPEECTALREALDSYASEQDRYSALYSIMCTKCRYLQDLLPSWGPTWKQNTGAYQYLAELKSYLDEPWRIHKNLK
jgi:vacuolar-type H+-ATPase subunit H